jgi:hypothetical protein
VAVAWARGSPPKPSLFTPIPSLSISAVLLPVRAGLELLELAAVLLFFSSSAAASRAACASASSRSRSYPSWRIRSASTAARRSASAKSTGAAFFAPRPFFAGRATPALVLVDDALLDVSVRTPPAVEVVLARREDDVTVRGAAEAEAGGEAGPGAETVRPIDGGAGGVDGEEVAFGFGEADLSQDEKKSSSSPAGCAELLEVSTPSTTIPLGNLCGAV